MPDLSGAFGAAAAVTTGSSSSLQLHRSVGDGNSGSVTVDVALHAEEGTVCCACFAPIRARDWVRAGLKGTRHDTCP
jgi:hypothetical protein